MWWWILCCVIAHATYRSTVRQLLLRRIQRRDGNKSIAVLISRKLNENVIIVMSVSGSNIHRVLKIIHKGLYIK